MSAFLAEDDSLFKMKYLHFKDKHKTVEGVDSDTKTDEVW